MDPQRAVIGKAAVILQSVDRGFERRTSTNAEGDYAFELVPPGRYTVRAEASGFAATTVKIEVVVATPVRVNLALQVQPLQQSVNVFGENGVAVQTENAGLGRTISPHEMSELPSLHAVPMTSSLSCLEQPCQTMH
jgi:hypothetical protein